MPNSALTLSDRATGALLGLAAGRRLVLGDASDGGLALALIAAEELAAGRRDLRSLAHRWAARHRAQPGDVDPETGAALAHLARHDAPPSEGAGTGSDPLVRAVPVALAAFDAPRTLVSATYHLVTLTHPAPEVGWSAVAVNVALARCLQGKRDFIPEVIEALRSNDAPEGVLAAVRRVPLLVPGRADSPDHANDPTPPLGSAVGDAVAALRLAYHEPRFERGLRTWGDLGTRAVGRTGLAGALLGARDGAPAIPPALAGGLDATALRALAVRLVRADAAVPA